VIVAGGRVLDLQLHLLDRQVVDRDGRPVCKVDDLELALDPAGRPYVRAILVGPRALGPRLGGRLGRWVAAIAQRLASGDDHGPPSIDFALVTDIGSAVTVARRYDELPIDPLEAWVEEHIIGRIPGSRHEGE
jgi:sporulation protein YlmC with PRC-barrel domain